MLFTPNPITPVEFELVLDTLCYVFGRDSWVPESFRKDTAQQLRFILQFATIPVRQGNDGRRYFDIEIERNRGRDAFWFYGCIEIKRLAKDHKLIARAFTTKIIKRWSFLGFASK